jgi:hypothetical protein
MPWCHDGTGLLTKYEIHNAWSLAGGPLYLKRINELTIYNEIGGRVDMGYQVALSTRCVD